MTLHPASLLLAWLSLALALQWMSLPALLGMAVMVFPIALWQSSRARFLLLLRRARWLLLSIVVLFALATPGISLPGMAGALGITQEGGLLAAAHVLRLTLLLALLALLLEHLGITALIEGLYTLLAPLGKSPRRGQMALRLLLVLDYVEQRQSGAQKGWQDWLDPQDARTEYAPIELKTAPLALIDYLVMALAVLGAMLAYAIAFPLAP